MAFIFQPIGALQTMIFRIIVERTSVFFQVRCYQGDNDVFPPESNRLMCMRNEDYFNKEEADEEISAIFNGIKQRILNGKNR